MSPDDAEHFAWLSLLQLVRQTSWRATDPKVGRPFRRRQLSEHQGQIMRFDSTCSCSTRHSQLFGFALSANVKSRVGLQAHGLREICGRVSCAFPFFFWQNWKKGEAEQMPLCPLWCATVAQSDSFSHSGFG